MDSQFFPALPFARRRDYAAAVAIEISQDSDNTYTALPLDRLTTIQAVLLQPTEDVDIRLAGQSNGDTPLLAGGIFVLADTEIDNSSNTGIMVRNNSGSEVILRGVALGS